MKKKRTDKVSNEEGIQLKCYYRNYGFELDEYDDYDKLDCLSSDNKLKNDQINNRNLDNSIRASTSKNELNLINLKNVYFKYNKNSEWILNSLNLSVPFNCIYTLIGSKKSGKSTILKLIVNLLRPISGRIDVFDYQITGEMMNKITNNYNNLPYNLIGYQSQELSIYEQLTINQLLAYIGKFYLMSKEEIKLRIKQLTCLFKLNYDQMNEQINKLTISEKYLINLLVSVLNNPALLILDEPFKMICPIIKDQIWNYLNDQVKQNQLTILITTSYYEEGRKFSNLIGFLRNGKLLIEEKSPDQLLINYNQLNLERVYLKLCKLERIKSRSTVSDPIFLQIKQLVDNRINQLNGNKLDDKLDNLNNRKTNNLKKFYFKSSVNRQLDSLNPIKVWLLKLINLVNLNFHKSFKESKLILIQLILPLIQISLFYVAFGNNPNNIRIGIVNDDKLLINNNSLSELYLKFIDPFIIEQINYDNLDQAIKDAKKLKLNSVLYIGDKFSEQLNNRIMLNDNLTNLDIIKSTIFLHSDLTNKFNFNIIENQLIRSFYKFIEHYIFEQYKLINNQIDNNQMNNNQIGNNQTNHNQINNNQLNNNQLNNNQTNYNRTVNQTNHNQIKTINKLSSFKYLNSIFLSFSIKESIFSTKLDQLNEIRSWKRNSICNFILNCVFLLSINIGFYEFNNERNRSIYERLFSINCTINQLIISKLIYQFMIMIIQIILIICLSIELFNLKIINSYLLILLIILIVNLNGYLIGILISSFINRFKFVLLITNIIYYYFLFNNNLISSINFMPKFISLIIQLNPITFASQCLENLIFRNLKSGIYSGYLISIIYLICFLYLNITKFRFVNLK